MTWLLAWILADFISGVIHWWEDKVLQPSKSHVLETIRKDNELHHSKPGAMLKLPMWDNVETSCMIGWPIAFILGMMGAPEVICIAIFYASFANLVHRFAHMRKPMWPIRSLQMVGIFQSPAHHWEHHHAKAWDDFGGYFYYLTQRQESKRRYCVMTDWLNPVLDWVGFWRLLERIFIRGKS